MERQVPNLVSLDIYIYIFEKINLFSMSDPILAMGSVLM